MADEVALKAGSQRRKDPEVGRYIDNGDGTEGNHNEQDIDNHKETKALEVSRSPRKGVGNEARWGSQTGEPKACKDEDKNDRVVTKKKGTKMTDDELKKMIKRNQKYGGAITSDQIRTAVMESQKDGGDRRDVMYKDEGAGRWGEDETEGEEQGGEHEGKGGGSQDRHYYLPAEPRLVEAHDSSTVVPRTGSVRSTPKPITDDNLPYSQHLRADKFEDEGAG